MITATRDPIAARTIIEISKNMLEQIITDEYNIPPNAVMAWSEEGVRIMFDGSLQKRPPGATIRQQFDQENR